MNSPLHAAVSSDALPTAGGSPPSAVSWGAVFAGAVGAAALSLILLILGMGLGLSSMSAFSGTSSVKLGGPAIAWLCFTQLAASGIGGYLAGRLRVRWNGVPRDEVYFRDTAHGFLAWATATLFTAAALGKVTSAVLNSGTPAAVLANAGTSTATTSAQASLWMFVSLLIGAFVASLSATYGGRQRDL